MKNILFILLFYLPALQGFGQTIIHSNNFDYFDVEKEINTNVKAHSTFVLDNNTVIMVLHNTYFTFKVERIESGEGFDTYFGKDQDGKNRALGYSKALKKIILYSEDQKYMVTVNPVDEYN